RHQRGQRSRELCFSFCSAGKSNCLDGWRVLVDQCSPSIPHMADRLQFRRRMTETNDRPQWSVFGFYLIAAVLIMYVSAGQRQPQPKTVAYSEFLTAIREGKLD